MSAKSGELVQLWLKKANNDLKNAEIILAAQTEWPPLDTVCFHCQQAVEKFLKAYLVYHGEKFPFTHNLADLVAICTRVDETFSNIQRRAETLTPFAVEIRYPDDFYMPTVEEANEAYVIASEIKDFILMRIDRRFSDISILSEMD
jgi:HEPN domain-containing protein